MVDILVLGATGLFGGHLARALADEPGVTLHIAARSKSRLDALAKDIGATPHVLDRNSPEDTLNQIKPFATVDCSGPFQTYGYDFARAVIASGSHYLDIADGADFVAGIIELNQEAESQGVCAFSGVSTTPALSSAIVADLVEGLSSVKQIETAIVPGNKTPRGLSVTQAILGQVGHAFRVYRAGQQTEVRGWTKTQKLSPRTGQLKLKPRRASLVDTPDAALFPEYFNAKTVLGRAGLELGLFHNSLRLLSRLPIPKLPLARPLLRLSSLFERFGSSTGGMRVRVIGECAQGPQERIWDMIIPDGEGPKTPIQPCLIVLRQLMAGLHAPGARAALSLFNRQEAEAQLTTLGAKFERRDREIGAIFTSVLGSDFADLPAQVQQLHQPVGITRWEGAAMIETATTPLAKLAAFCAGFPKTSGEVPASVEIDPHEGAEAWTRKMGSKTFRSILRLGPDGMTERFGPFLFDLGLHVEDGKLHYPVLRGRVFGLIPIPNALLPVSQTWESVDEEGRFTFNVRVTLRSGDLVVHYQGHLEPA